MAKAKTKKQYKKDLFKGLFKEKLAAAVSLDRLALVDIEQLLNLPPQVESEHSVPNGFCSEILTTVRDRGSTYGSPADNHQTTADLLSTWLTRRFGREIALSAEDVIAINILQKMSRLAFSSKNDSWLDVAGYTENVAMLRQDQRNTLGPNNFTDLREKKARPTTAGFLGRDDMLKR